MKSQSLRVGGVPMDTATLYRVKAEPLMHPDASMRDPETQRRIDGKKVWWTGHSKLTRGGLTYAEFSFADEPSWPRAWMHPFAVTTDAAFGPKARHLGNPPRLSGPKDFPAALRLLKAMSGLRQPGSGTEVELGPGLGLRYRIVAPLDRTQDVIDVLAWNGRVVDTLRQGHERSAHPARTEYRENGARMAPQVEDFASADRALGEKWSRTIGHNTRLERDGDAIIRVILHHTPIVLYHADGSFTLNSGNYRTVTTKSRMNEVLPMSIRVVQKAGDWFVREYGPAGTEIPFFDWMRLARR